SALPEARALGEAIAPRVDWSIDWPASARRLASIHPVAPTGTAYVLVRHAGAPAGARLRVEIEWEEHARMKWSAVTLDASGKPRGRVAIPAMARGVEAHGTIAELDGADAILLAGTNVGDADVPFDPDDDVWEPHGFLVTVASE